MPPSPLTLTLPPSLEATHAAKGNKHFLALHYLCITLSVTYSRGRHMNSGRRLRVIAKSTKNELPAQNSALMNEFVT